MLQIIHNANVYLICKTVYSSIVTHDYEGIDELLTVVCLFLCMNMLSAVLKAYLGTLTKILKLSIKNG